jgi:hypothetical protein
MNIQTMQPLQNICIEISKLKEQIITELPHYGHQSLFYENDEITTGLMNNTVEIKIHLGTGQLQWYNNEKNYTVELFTNDITESINEIAAIFSVKGPEKPLQNIDYQKIESFRNYAIAGKHVLELFRMRLSDNFTLIHLWPHHFDFSVEWFTGNGDEQIGTGISPGDQTNTEPYIYMNPFPFNDSILEKKLPIGKWHNDSWKGVKIEWKDFLKFPPKDAATKLYETYNVVKTNFD